MPVLMPAKSADFEPPPEGSHIGICYRVIDLGTQDTTYLGATTRKHLIIISWELPDERMGDGRPFTISKRYTYSSSPKANLRKDLESWRGKKFEDRELGMFDIGKLIGIGCMLNVVHAERNDTTYANITAIMRLPRGTVAPDPINPPLSFSLNDRPFDRASYEQLSDRLREIVAKAPEYKRAIGAMPAQDDNEPPPVNRESDYGVDDIPF